METWRKIEDYDNYSISDFGNVRNDTTNKILKPNINRCGYKYVSLCENGKPKSRTVHRLVCVTFLNNPNDKSCVDHINNDKIDNRKENLRWASKSENGRNACISSKNTTGFKGVYFDKRNSNWIAQCVVDGDKFHLGSFKDIHDAASAVTSFREEHHKEFARN
jgi:hypothetical protein